MEEENQHTFEKWQQERLYLESQKKITPEFFLKAENRLGIAEQLSRVGIVMPHPEISKGFIKYYPFDFIVEEIIQSGEVVSVDFAPPSLPTGTGPFLVFDLVKVGISTIDVVRELSTKLKIKNTQIGYGGIKDAIALTAQRISVSGVNPESLLNLPDSNFFIKNIRYSSEAISMKSIAGNRFTILVRTEAEPEQVTLEHRMAEIKENGFYNFFWLQRFGNRLIGHLLGLYLLQGKEEKAIRTYLCEPGPNELPFFINLRKEANKQYGNWNEMIKIFSPLGFSLRNEMMILNYLKEFRSDFTGALRSIPEQAKMWVQAYSSFLFNKVLSFGAAKQYDLPTKIPVLLSNSQQDLKLYENFLKMDNVPQDFNRKIQRLDFIRMVSRQIESKLFIKPGPFKIVPEGVVMNFDLPKGAYATAFLSHIFSLDERIVDRIKNTVYDPKELLDIGSIKETRKKLEKYIVIRKTEDLDT
jgi:TruD family tRNA pseudouridine synthase